MFTGELVDNRSRAQKHADEQRSEPRQQAMFKLPEVLGEVKARPVIDTSNLASAPLVLISEDTRSEEEKEADLRRASEALTKTMFADETGTEEVNLAQPEPAADNKTQAPPKKSPVSAKEGAYLELVEIVCERITTLWIDDSYQSQFELQLGNAILAAQVQGLTSKEIGMAIQAGKHRGEQERAVTHMKTSTPAESSEQIVYTASQEVAPARFVEGHRRRMRRESVKLRRREQNKALMNSPD